MKSWKMNVVMITFLRYLMMKDKKRWNLKKLDQGKKGFGYFKCGNHLDVLADEEAKVNIKHSSSKKYVLSGYSICPTCLLIICRVLFVQSD